METIQAQSSVQNLCTNERNRPTDVVAALYPDRLDHDRHILALTTTFPIPQDVERLLVWADTAVCLFLLADFLQIFFRSRNKIEYLLKWGWIDLLSAIPLIEAFRWGRLARIIRILRLFKGVKSAAQLVRVLARNRR